jgi:hypothetical protein
VLNNSLPRLKNSYRQLQVSDAEDGALGRVGEALDFPAVREAKANMAPKDLI